MVGKNDRISDMCLCFSRNESNESVRISYSTDILFCSIVAFTYLENWNKGRGAFILRQLVKQFTLDIVVFDPYNLFVSQKCSFDEGEYKGNTIVCSIPFDPNFFLKIYRLIILDITTPYYYKYYN